MTGQSSMSNSGDWLWRSIKRNPEGLLLVAAGAALLMRTAGPSKAKSAPSDSSDSFLNNDISAAATQTKDTVSEFSSSASEFASQTTERVRKAASTTTDKATEAARQTRSSAQSYASRMLDEQPLVFAVAGLAASAVLAAAFPATQMEKDTLGPIGNQASHAAQRVGDQLKDATMAAGETLKNAARERGISQEGLKEVAADAANAFSSRMSGHDEPANDASGKPEAPATSDPRF
jgi:hypothetical protein